MTRTAIVKVERSPLKPVTPYGRPVVLEAVKVCVGFDEKAEKPIHKMVLAWRLARPEEMHYAI